jgi:hypothetical protein
MIVPICSWEGQREKLDRLKVGSVPPHSHVHVRAGHHSGRPRRSDLSAFLYPLSHFYVDLREVHIGCEEVLLVVDDKNFPS